MVLDGAETVYDCDQEEAARMLIEVVRMAYFADEAPKLGRAADLIDAVTAADRPSAGSDACRQLDSRQAAVR